MKIKKNFKNSLFKHSYSRKFLIIDSKFVFQNVFHYYGKFKRRKKSKKKKKEKKDEKQKKKNNYKYNVIYTHTFSNNISNHHFLQIYTAHRFPHPSPKSWCVYLGLDLRSCKLSKWFCSWLISSKEGRVFNLATNLALIFCHTFFIHTQADLVFQNVDLNSFTNHIRYN